MLVRVLRNKAGFTLVEVLVAMLILAIGMLGSVLGMMTALNHSLGNELRNEAIKIAQHVAEEARNMPYSSVQKIPSTQTVNMQVRKSLASFTVNTVTTPASGYSVHGVTKLSITVQWTLKKKTHSYLLETVVRQTR
ncbi:MAG: prepilin-type N-terminal cleavage/methylation domain-containing protein [Desulfobacteraceae bacterium]|nr:prepilin-type N-terminal cleavage/methylation domain-containing protein [Desulfobacteraceae bacterium]